MSQVFTPTDPITYPISVANGGTGSDTAPSALTALGAAANGVNTDITSLTADDLLGTTLTIGTDTGSIGFYGATPSTIQTGTGPTLDPQGGTYDDVALNTALDDLSGSINALINQLITLGLLA